MKAVLLIFVFFIFVSVHAQRIPDKFSFSGKVIADSTKLPLEGATIYIADLRKGTISDQTGHFQLTNIPFGTYLVEIKFVGYKSIIRNIYFNQNISKDYAMQISVTEENEIVVTGASRATSLRRNPIPIISISRQYLQQNLSTNVIDAIAKVPGISAVTTGPNVSKPFIRGLGFNRILTLYDGVRQEGQQWGDEHGVEIDHNTVDKVEVVKGPASLVYGSDAVAGVVNLLPPDPPHENKVSANLVNEYQTNNGLIENSLTLSGAKEGLSWRSTMTHKLAKDYRNKFDGRVYNTGFEESDVSAMIGLSRKWGFSHTGISIFDDKQEIPDGSRDSMTRKFTRKINEADTIRQVVQKNELNSYHVSHLHQRVQHYRIYNSNSFTLGSGRLGVNLAWQRSVRREFSHPQSELPGLWLKLNTYSYDLKYFFHEKKGFGITAGINGLYQRNKSGDGTEFIIPSYHQFDIGPFIFIKKTLGSLELAGGMRYDARKLQMDALYWKEDVATGFQKAVYGTDTTGATRQFSARRKTFSGLSGSVGFSYRFNDHLSIKMNIGRGYRAPNISEISSEGIHPGTNAYQLGNKNFKPEFNLQEDVGISYNSKHVSINAEIFVNNIQNYIYNQKLLGANGQDSIVVPGNQTFQYRAAKANLYGGEFTVDIHPHPFDWLHFENSLSIIYGNNQGVEGQLKISDSARYLPLIPPLHTISELRTSLKKIGPRIANAFFKVQMEYYARQNRVYLENNTETATPAYQLFNIGMGADILNKKGTPVFTVHIIADNILDKGYQSHLNRLKYFESYPDNKSGRNGIYNMGRNISLRVNVPFDLKH